MAPGEYRNEVEYCQTGQIGITFKLPTRWNLNRTREVFAFVAGAFVVGLAWNHCVATVMANPVHIPECHCFELTVFDAVRAGHLVYRRDPLNRLQASAHFLKRQSAPIFTRYVPNNSEMLLKWGTLIR